MEFISVMANLNFTPVFSDTWLIKNADLVLKKHHLLLMLWLLNIFVETKIFSRILWWTKSSKPHLFETEIFCNMTNVFPTTFDQFNVSLLNKSIDSFKKKIFLTTNVWTFESLFLWYLSALSWKQCRNV